MEDDQQFCLRWNNHQSTLVAVFDTLLENGTLVDCTLAAEGKYLNAHKVVLSACSPYFESLLSQNYDKHPIFILKDVKYQELKAMMDYMYRGEVNISQDQLGALLKAAESLQIKGLSDNRKGETETRKTVAPPPPPAKSPPPTTSIPRVQGLTIEQRRREMEESREGSQSPGARKKKRIRRRSLDDLIDNHHDASNSSESHHSSQTPAQNIPTILPAAPSKIATDVPEPIESKSDILTRHKSTTESEVPQVPIIKEKIETHSELMLEPKAEYIEEMNEDSIEDLTLDDDDISNMDQMDDQGAGPSHGSMGEGSGQGFGGWHMGNQSQDEVFLAAQEAVGAHRDSQDMKQLWYNYCMGMDATALTEKRYQCDNCHRSYKHQSNLCNHKREECGKDPSYFCPFCSKGFKKKQHLQRHVVSVHGPPQLPINLQNIPTTYSMNMPLGLNRPPIDATMADNMPLGLNRPPIDPTMADNMPLGLNLPTNGNPNVGIKFEPGLNFAGLDPLSLTSSVPKPAALFTPQVSSCETSVHQQEVSNKKPPCTMESS